MLSGLTPRGNAFTIGGLVTPFLIIYLLVDVTDNITFRR